MPTPVPILGRGFLLALLGFGPDSLETFTICKHHIAAFRLAEAEHRCVRSRDAVGVLVDEELTVCSINRVVQGGLVKSDLDVRARH